MLNACGHMYLDAGEEMNLTRSLDNYLSLAAQQVLQVRVRPRCFWLVWARGTFLRGGLFPCPRRWTSLALQRLSWMLIAGMEMSSLLVCKQPCLSRSCTLFSCVPGKGYAGCRRAAVGRPTFFGPGQCWRCLVHPQEWGRLGTGLAKHTVNAGAAAPAHTASPVCVPEGMCSCLPPCRAIRTAAS